MRTNFIQALDLRVDGLQFLLQMMHPGLGHQHGIAIGSIQFGEVACDTGFELLDTGVELPVGEVLVAIVHGLELAAVNGDEGIGKQVEPPAQQDEFAADATDRRALVFPEVRNGLTVRP